MSDEKIDIREITSGVPKPKQAARLRDHIRAAIRPDAKRKKAEQAATEEAKAHEQRTDKKLRIGSASWRRAVNRRKTQ